MGIESIGYYHFRNLQDSTIDCDYPEIYLIGENGQGKTNFIESIYLTCYGSSFRTRQSVRQIRIGEKEASVHSEYKRTNHAKRTVQVKLFPNKKKEIKIDSHTIKDRKELLEGNLCLFFGHSDMDYAIGPPEMKRKFFNQTLCLLEPLFMDKLNDYRHILRSRNAVLKSSNTELLDVYDIQISRVGMEVQKRREQLIEEFNGTFLPLYRSVSGLKECVEICYLPSWKADMDQEKIIKFLRKNRSRDKIMSTTTTGPHRDRIVFMISGRNFSYTASTGQIRLLSLALKVSQAHYIRQKTGKEPILLLDDVLLELDDTRKEAFIEHLPEYDQIFFTFLPNENYLRFATMDTKIYGVTKGGLVEWKKQGIY